MRNVIRFILLFSIACANAWAESELYVSRHAAKILPHRIVTIPSPENGELKILSFGKGRINADTDLAILNESVFLLEEKEMELNIRRLRHELNKNILALNKQKEELNFIKEQPQTNRGFMEQRLKVEPDEKVLASLDEEIHLLEEKARLDEDRLRQGIEKKRKACVLTMPFSGMLQYHIPLPEKEGEIMPITASTPIATVIDDSVFYVVINAADPSWSKMEHKRLLLSVNLGNGEKIKARWHSKKVDKGNQGETLYYYFQLPAEHNDKAFSLLGANIIAELYYEAENDWLYESKSALALEAGSTQINTWEELVTRLRPGYHIVFIGETHLCLKKKS